MLEWSINVIKQLDISSKFMAFEEFFSQGRGSSKTSSKSNFEEVLRGVSGVDGVASHDVALKTDDSENRRRNFFTPADDLRLEDSLCDFRRPLTSWFLTCLRSDDGSV